MTENTKHRLLIFVVAYNAETTLLPVLDRIPENLFDLFETEILVIDDASSDNTFTLGADRAKTWSACKITVLKNPKNQGYGGNQKLGYEYAVKHGYDSVALLHGDGQYAPEKLPDLVSPIANGEADAVFGSRMLESGAALKGKMPLYKFVGNKILTTFQNAVLKADLSEFHSGFRAYSVKMLAKIPFQYNSNDFHFDTDIIIQLLMGGYRISEIPMPTYYGDEVCYVNGMKYAKDVMVSTLASRVHRMGIRYQRKFDVDQDNEHYDLKLGYPSSHTMAIDAIPEGARVLDLGCGPGLVARELKRKSCHVVGLDQFPPPAENIDRFIEWDLDSDALPAEVGNYDYILMLDIIEHLKSPEKLVDILRRGARASAPTIIMTTANVAFFIPRIMFLFGQFNYGKAGILDITHTRLFTFSSLRNMLRQSGYEIEEIRGIPAPFPKAFGNQTLGNLLIKMNELGIRLNKRLFSYQMYFKITPLPTVDSLLEETIVFSEEKRVSKEASASSTFR